MRIKVLIVVLALMGIAFPQSKTEKIRMLLDLTGVANQVQIMKTQFVSIVKSSSPDVPTALLDTMFSRMNKDGLYAITIPIYDRNLDEATIDGLITFYKSPAGQEIIRKLPIIMQESMQGGALWGRQVMEQIIRDLKQKGYQVQGI